MTIAPQSHNKRLNPKEIKFYNLLKNDPRFDYILFPEKIEGDFGYFPLLEERNLLGKDKSYYLLAMCAIAKFHHFSQDMLFDFMPINDKYYSQSLENTLKYAVEQKIDLPTNQMDELVNSLKLIQAEPQPIHDDFLPQNVMVTNRGVKIIDWEDMRYGFSEHDIGRFLGDLNSEKPSWDKKYYPLSWHDDLENEYLNTRCQLDLLYNIQKEKKLVHLGEMWNYLGPIEMCLKREDTTSDWFHGNLNALKYS